MKNDLLERKNFDQLDYKKSEDIYKDIRMIIESSQKMAYQSVDIILLKRNWLIGKRIYEEELNQKDRAKYGLKVIKELSESLTLNYGKGFNKTNLYLYLSFYEQFPEIFHTVSGKSMFLSWTHYRILLQVHDLRARKWYEDEALNQTWSVRTLQRNIASQYYYRKLNSANPSETEKDMMNITSEFQNKLEFIKNPVIAEFLDMKQNEDINESDLEQRIIDNLQRFILELGKGYAFVERQQHIHTEKEEYYIDLVFYNYILKCFVLIDLKTRKITHQDVGQMDMYVRMYDELKRNDDDNPTLGIVLCSETDEDIARYSILHDNEQLFMSKYKLYLPDEEELKAEIDNQKMLFYLQHNEEDLK